MQRNELLNIGIHGSFSFQSIFWHSLPCNIKVDCTDHILRTGLCIMYILATVHKLWTTVTLAADWLVALLTNFSILVSCPLMINSLAESSICICLRKPCRFFSLFMCGFTKCMEWVNIWFSEPVPFWKKIFFLVFFYFFIFFYICFGGLWP